MLEQQLFAKPQKEKQMESGDNNTTTEEEEEEEVQCVTAHLMKFESAAEEEQNHNVREN